MAERKNLDGLSLTVRRGITVMDLGDMEIWDGADLSLLRDGLNHVILQCGIRSVAVDMTSVKYVPSGFFGMLFDWHEQGVTIRLLGPLERVRNMIWFRQFFSAEGDCWYLLHDGLAVRVDDAHDADQWPDAQEAEWDSAVEESSTVTADR